MKGYVTIEQWGQYVRLVFHKTRQASPRDQPPSWITQEEGIDDEGDFWVQKWEAEELAEFKKEESERCAIVRARSRVRELAFCNDWQYFFTGTLDGSKIDRYDLKGYVKRLGEWISNYNRKYGVNLMYLLVPEQHKDGAFHIHGLLNGVHPRSLVRNDNGFFEIAEYRKRFGFMSLSPVKDHSKVCSYVTKYITKEQGKTMIEFNKHRYYASRNLQKSVKHGGYWCDENGFRALGGFENEWCIVHMNKIEGDIRTFVRMLEENGKIEGGFYDNER